VVQSHTEPIQQHQQQSNSIYIPTQHHQQQRYHSRGTSFVTGIDEILPNLSRVVSQQSVTIEDEIDGPENDNNDVAVGDVDDAAAELLTRVVEEDESTRSPPKGSRRIDPSLIAHHKQIANNTTPTA